MTIEELMVKYNIKNSKHSLGIITYTINLYKTNNTKKFKKIIKDLERIETYLKAI